VDGRIAFAGDLLSSNGRVHAQDLSASDWAAVQDSLAHLQSLEPECVYPGHGRTPIDGSALQGLNRA
jgi:glyoxylase-like metal-dependent hydrolase (beta-lactamase superfamily II)